ncbi:MAG: hypothetical protein P8P30_02345 [Rickettsiales bacterium]|nr:hypothetical protein [Rickettsiales bacterium]
MMNPQPIPAPPPLPPKEVEPESQNLQNETPETASSIELEHLESINISDALETANEAPLGDEGFSIGDENPIGEESDLASSGVLSADEFYNGVFSPLHTVPAALLKLESLPIRQSEEPAARNASDALYDIALETPLFRFLIEPSNLWVQRAVAIGAYAIPKSRAVMFEIKARKAQAAEVEENDKTEQ